MGSLFRSNRESSPPTDEQIDTGQLAYPEQWQKPLEVARETFIESEEIGAYQLLLARCFAHGLQRIAHGFIDERTHPIQALAEELVTEFVEARKRCRSQEEVKRVRLIDKLSPLESNYNRVLAKLYEIHRLMPATLRQYCADLAADVTALHNDLDPDTIREVSTPSPKPSDWERPKWSEDEPIL